MSSRILGPSTISPHSFPILGSVMEPNDYQANDYRLERWLAILLSLLFFLPFVARADDIAYTGLFHGEDMPYRTGEEFLAFTPEAVLIPVKIAVTIEEDPIVDNPGERTGRLVSVAGLEDATLVRGNKLHPGKVTRAQPDAAELLPPSSKAIFHLGRDRYDLSYRCRGEECTLVLASGGVAQDLATFESHDLAHTIHFAGDLDHDGRLDLIADLPWHYNVGRSTLWLSSAAKEGQLVAMTAELRTSGC